MEDLLQLESVVDSEEVIVPTSSNEQFISANTEAISFEDVRTKCIIPVFRDNESTISHPEFIEAVIFAAQSYFKHESLMPPVVRVSHPIKGRIPSAIGKPVSMLREDEKTIYYERCAWIMEIPSIRDTINGNQLSLTIGGVRAYNTDNLHGKKTEERFKVFIGFKNKVCCNLCISTDGFRTELRARSVNEIVQESFALFGNYRAEEQVRVLGEFADNYITERQFAQLVGRSRLYQYLPAKVRKEIPYSIPLMDSQISTVGKDYYSDKSFCRSDDGSINLWRLYNLFTGSNKSSYIDTFLDRGAGSHSFIQGLQNALKTGSEFWFLD